MNANELADGLAQMYIEGDVNGLFNKRIQNMLRQFGLAESIVKQQGLEIKALKKEVTHWQDAFHKAWGFDRKAQEKC